MSNKITASLQISYDAELANKLTINDFLDLSSILDLTSDDSGKIERRHYTLSNEEIIKAANITEILTLIATRHLGLMEDSVSLGNKVNPYGKPELNPTTDLYFYLDSDSLPESFEHILSIMARRYGIGVHAIITTDEDFAWEIVSELNSKEFFVNTLNRIAVYRQLELEAMEKKYNALNLFLNAEPERLHTAKTLAVLLAISKESRLK